MLGAVADCAGAVDVAVGVFEEPQQELGSQHAAHRRVYCGHRDGVVLNEFEQPPAEAHRLRRLYVHPGLDCLPARLLQRIGCLVERVEHVDGFPVGVGVALKAQFLAQDLSRQPLGRRAGDAVELVIRRHHRHRTGLADRGLECGQIGVPDLSLARMDRPEDDPALGAAVGGEVWHRGAVLGIDTWPRPLERSDIRDAHPGR